MALEDVPTQEECRLIAEDYWRRFLPCSLQSDIEGFKAVVMDFETQLLRRAESMSSLEAGKTFVGRVNVERDRLADEYEADRDGLVRRLGLWDVLGARVTAPSASGALGDVVVNTAVRATVWNLISKLFR